MNRVRDGLLGRRAVVRQELKALIDHVARESRALTAQEEAQWDRLNRELAAVDRQLRKLLVPEERPAGFVLRATALTPYELGMRDGLSCASRALDNAARQVILLAWPSPRRSR